MSNSQNEPVERRRGAVFECGKCRVNLTWDPLAEEYRCPECGWSQ